MAKGSVPSVSSYAIGRSIYIAQAKIRSAVLVQTHSLLLQGVHNGLSIALGCSILCSGLASTAAAAAAAEAAQQQQSSAAHAVKREEPPVKTTARQGVNTGAAAALTAEHQQQATAG
jgi:hypothetical protein